MVTRTILAVLLFATAANAQTVLTRTNEINGNISASESISGLAGAWRITLSAVDGGSPVDLSAAAVRFTVQDTVDGKLIVSNTPTAVSATGGVYRGEATIGVRADPAMSSAPYAVRFTADDLIIYWAELIVTNAAPSTSGGGTVVVTSAPPSVVVNPVIETTIYTQMFSTGEAYYIPYAATVELSPTNGYWQTYSPTSAAIISVASSDTGKVDAIRLDLFAGSQAITFATTVINRTTSLLISTSACTSILLDSQVGKAVWDAFQLR